MTIIRKTKYDEFKDNRHEQSISSVLRKKIGSVVIDGDESWMQPFGRGESLKYPFWATRYNDRDLMMRYGINK